MPRNGGVSFIRTWSPSPETGDGREKPRGSGARRPYIAGSDGHRCDWISPRPQFRSRQRKAPGRFGRHPGPASRSSLWMVKEGAVRVIISSGRQRKAPPERGKSSVSTWISYHLQWGLGRPFGLVRRPHPRMAANRSRPPSPYRTKTPRATVARCRRERSFARKAPAGCRRPGGSQCLSRSGRKRIRTPREN
jgi:hypothetical protein